MSYTANSFLQMLQRISSKSNFAVCDTAASSASKTITISNFSLVTGTSLIVYFTLGNTAANMAININNEGNIDCKLNGNSIPIDLITEKATVNFVYDGTNFNLISANYGVGGSGDASVEELLKLDNEYATNKFVSSEINFTSPTILNYASLFENSVKWTTPSKGVLSVFATQSSTKIFSGDIAMSLEIYSANDKYIGTYNISTNIRSTDGLYSTIALLDSGAKVKIKTYSSYCLTYNIQLLFFPFKEDADLTNDVG